MLMSWRAHLVPVLFLQRSRHCLLTVSKEMRVRAEGLVKIMHMVYPRKGLKLVSCFCASLPLAIKPRSSIFCSSSVEKSSMCRKCLPFKGGETVAAE
eukprot:1161552-Pelagomonas_calceolata.AAC.4